MLVHGCLASLVANSYFISADCGHFLIIRKYFLRGRQDGRVDVITHLFSHLYLLCSILILLLLMRMSHRL